MKLFSLLFAASGMFLVSCQNFQLPWKKNQAANTNPDPTAAGNYAYGNQYPNTPAYGQPNAAPYGQYPQQPAYPQYPAPGYGAEQAQVYPATGAGYAPPATYDTPDPVSAPASGGGRSYTVKKGDTLFGISKKTGVKVARLMSANGLSSDMIRVGQSLRIP